MSAQRTRSDSEDGVVGTLEGTLPKISLKMPTIVLSYKTDDETKTDQIYTTAEGKACGFIMKSVDILEQTYKHDVYIEMRDMQAGSESFEEQVCTSTHNYGALSNISFHARAVHDGVRIPEMGGLPRVDRLRSGRVDEQRVGSPR